MFTINRFHDTDWERFARDWGAWWAGELDRPLVTLEGGAENTPRPHFFTSSYPLAMPAEEVLDCYEQAMAARLYYADAFPVWYPDFGPGMMAGFLGAGVVPVVDETVWFEPLPTHEIGTLELPSDWSANVWWQRVETLTRRAAERWQGAAAVGMVDLGGGLDILAHLRTSAQVLLDLSDTPEEVARLAGTLTRLWLRAYDALYALGAEAGCGTSDWAGMWAPGKGYMLQCDLSYMISPAMFARFVLPDLEASTEHLDYAFYHLDGEAQLSHLDQLLALPRLRGVQTVPCNGTRRVEGEWLAAMQRIRAAGKLVQPWGLTPEGALEIVRTLGGKGFQLRIGQEMKPDEARAFLALLEREDIGRRG